MRKMAINAMSDQPAQVSNPTHSDPDLILAPHPGNASPYSSSASDDNNVNGLFRLSKAALRSMIFN